MAKLPDYYKVSVNGLMVKLDPIYEEMVEVVRCKDCKQYYETVGGGNCRWWNRRVTDGDFCSYGERRGGE